MIARILTITLSPDWVSGIKVAGERAIVGISENRYQGETLNFETPGVFLVNSLKIAGTLSALYSQVVKLVFVN